MLFMNFVMIVVLFGLILVIYWIGFYLINDIFVFKVIGISVFVLVVKLVIID